MFRTPLRALLLAIACLAASASFAQNTIKEDPALTAIVDATGFAGMVLAYDLKADQYYAGHAERANLQLIPASTFKVFSA